MNHFEEFECSKWETFFLYQISDSGVSGILVVATVHHLVFSDWFMLSDTPEQTMNNSIFSFHFSTKEEKNVITDGMQTTGLKYSIYCLRKMLVFTGDLQMREFLLSLIICVRMEWCCYDTVEISEIRNRFFHWDDSWSVGVFRTLGKC